jgi:hypothetical protein
MRASYSRLVSHFGCVYRVLKSELVIIIANTVSLALLFGIFYFKLRARYRLTRLLRR